MTWPLVSRTLYDAVLADRDLYRSLYFEAVARTGAPVPAAHQPTVKQSVRPDPEAQALERLNGEAIERGIARLKDLYQADGRPVPTEDDLRKEAATLWTSVHSQ